MLPLFPAEHRMDGKQLADALHEQGWLLWRDFISEHERQGLAEHVRALAAADKLAPARIGHGASQQSNLSIRGDAIAWIDDATEPVVAQVMQRLQQIQQQVNEQLMLGLFEFEGHYALYPPGAGYRRHLDQFRDSDTRRLTAVLYLNEGPWDDADGGHLRLFLQDQEDSPWLDIAPEGGTLLLFLSGRFYHEVRPTRRERLSLTGWFRVRER